MLLDNGICNFVIRTFLKFFNEGIITTFPRLYSTTDFRSSRENCIVERGRFDCIYRREAVDFHGAM